MGGAGGYGPRPNTPKEMQLLHCQPEESELEATHRREKAATMMTRGMCHGASQLFHYYHAITDLKLKKLVGDFNAFNNLFHMCDTFNERCKVCACTCCLRLTVCLLQDIEKEVEDTEAPARKKLRTEPST